MKLLNLIRNVCRADLIRFRAFKSRLSHALFGPQFYPVERPVLADNVVENHVAVTVTGPDGEHLADLPFVDLPQPLSLEDIAAETKRCTDIVRGSYGCGLTVEVKRKLISRMEKPS